MENESLVKLETAFLAQEKGFNWNTVFGLDSFNRIRAKLAHNTEGSFISWDKHDHNLRLPTQAVLQKWLRKEHKIIVLILEVCEEYPGDSYFIPEISVVRGHKLENSKKLEKINKSLDCLNSSKTFQEILKFNVEVKNSWEEALEIGLQEALKLVKNGDK